MLTMEVSYIYIYILYIQTYKHIYKLTDIEFCPPTPPFPELGFKTLEHIYKLTDIEFCPPTPPFLA